MILSVSRRTDIPNYYSDWFLNRINQGYLYVRNPMNPHQISKINLSPQVVDCIVFWTKNPEPMFSKLEELKDYSYYFQFTMTGYGKDIEPGMPHKRDHMIGVFQELSNKIGRERVIWRYDPILFNERYTPDYHLKAFTEIAEKLNGYTEKVVISFVDSYAKIQKRMREIDESEISMAELTPFARALKGIAEANHMSIGTCAENLSACGIEHGSCIDQKLIERTIGCVVRGKKDRNQREVCGCMESIDVGAYDTCPNHCIYCYAIQKPEAVSERRKLYDPKAPLLCGEIGEGDRITERKMCSLKEGQYYLF